MKFIECAQGTPDWFAARVGKITASCFADAISRCTRKSGTRNVGDPTAVADRYAADLAIERISGQPHGEPPRAWVLERGHEMEAAARRLYEGREGAFVTEAGICLTDDGIFGYSTDGLVDDDGLIEIKAPIDSTKIVDMWRTGDTSEYDHQMQGGMWITNRKWCDFIMHVPDLACIGKDLYIKRVFRDETFIDSLVMQLAAFNQLAMDYESVLRGLPNEVIDADFQEVMTGSAPVEPAQILRPADAWPAAPTLRLGQITDRLGFPLTSQFIGSLGFEPAERVKAAMLYHERDFPSICAALIRHISAAQAKQAA